MHKILICYGHVIYFFNCRYCISSIIISVMYLCIGISQLQVNYYSKSCPKAEEIIKQQVNELYNKHGNTAISWVRNLFHDCIVKVSINI